MEFFPYLSGWILGISCIFLLYQLFAYLPYGKFAIQDAPFAQWHSIHPGVAFAIPYILSLFFVSFGWFEDNTWNVNKLPQMPKGWLALVTLILYYTWRIVSQLVIHRIINPPNGQKQTSILFTLVQLLYYPAVAMNFRRMCYYIDTEIETKDVIFVTLTFLALAANAYVDISLNIWRKDKDIATDYGWHGLYITSSEIKKRFAMLGMCGIEPNYAFEILAWVFFTVFTWRFESLWWLVATLCILIPRMMWSSYWYSL